MDTKCDIYWLTYPSDDYWTSVPHWCIKELYHQGDHEDINGETLPDE